MDAIEKAEIFLQAWDKPEIELSDTEKIAIQLIKDLLWMGDNLKTQVAIGCNYVANHDTYPSEVRFANGRIVRILHCHGEAFLEITTA